MRVVLLFIFLYLTGPFSAIANGLNHDDLLLLTKLVNINTSTDNVKGLKSARTLLISKLKSLGLYCNVYDVENNHKVLMCESKSAKPSILLLGHIDTVFSKSSKFQSLHVINGKIIGPGVIDMKGGLVLILSLLRELKQQGDIGKIRVILNDDEETGSSNSKTLVGKLTDDVPNILVFEPGLPDGSVVTSESGASWVKLTVIGKSAHAGLEPQNGMNACVELASKILRINSLSDFSKSLSLNVGVITGGSKPNIVCDEASATIDIRYVGEEDLKYVLSSLKSIQDDFFVNNLILKSSPTSFLTNIASNPPFPEARSNLLFGKVQKIGLALGYQIRGKHVGYASDANHLSKSNHQILVGLGPYGGGMHTDEEFLIPESFKERFDLNIALIRDILKSDVNSK